MTTIVLLSALAMPAWGETGTSSFPEIHDWNSLVITLARGCGRSFRSCPRYDVEIHGDGTVVFEGRANVAALGHHEAHVSRAAVRALVAKFRAAHFFALTNHRVFDGPIHVLTVEFDDQTKSIGNAPGAGDLMDAVEKAAGTARWVGHAAGE